MENKKEDGSSILAEIVSATQSAEIREKVLAAFNKADDHADFYWVKSTEFIAKGGVELRVAIRAAASIIVPSIYIEIGTRYGWSAAQAYAEMDSLPLAFCVDRWEENYAGLETRGPGYACGQIQGMGGPHLIDPLMIGGDSHKICPDIGYKFQGIADLVVVDGDHRASGAWFDICDLMPTIKIGGAIVMDDLFPTAHEAQLGLSPAIDDFNRPLYPIKEYSLLHLWRYLPTAYPNFAFWDNSNFDDLSAFPHGVSPVGIAVRVK